MKDNVDLTENRDFQNNITQLGRISKLSRNMIFNMHPWLQEVSFDYRNSKEIIPIGSKRERGSHQLYERYKEGIECERCGIDFSNKPWNGDWGMCFKCEKEMDSQMSDDLIF